ncbi:hypothetical protein AUK40_02405 [Candidatus Wirthbacteria bacterium CG2_30_54_11]|uniref:ABC transmembrane type-1 domain-containing protein n=1 Tax=Candidatus Wirthbacteria bacterium CG2_30_54_11 TaxID=1817892 RepID=A0A1J5IM94_9BACT|nr:MAG: hypothetical protein AUK40_02405 [Candidatus Wirthbacteria bacterium CG2_30_54_11]
MKEGDLFMKRFLFVLFSLLSLLVFWQVLSTFSGYPSFILPSPALVAERAVRAWEHGKLWGHILTTLSETMSGFFVSGFIACSLAYTASEYSHVRYILSPYLIAIQSIPILAVAPLLMIWFGNGYQTKVLIAAVVAFLPMFAAALEAFGSLDRLLLLDMQALGGSRWQTFSKLKLPAALPGILSGLRVGLSLSLMGAVVGEFIGAQQGLGYLINAGKGVLDTPLVFVAIISLVGLGLALYGAISLVSRVLVRLR